MKLERTLRGIAGIFVLASVALSYYHSQWWLLFTAFVGLNLTQSAVTDWCLMKTFLQKLGLKTCEEESGPARMEV